jgi:hypothetical protein
MTLNPDQEQLFTDPSPDSNAVFVNERVSFQTENQQRLILVQGVVFSYYSLQDRATLPVVSVTRLAPYAVFNSGSNPED